MKLLICICLLLTSVAAFASAKPNIIVILADDLGYADVGFHDIVADGIHTPNLDRLADSGTVFHNAYSSSPICSGARLSLQTGRYGQRWGAYFYNEGGLPNEEQSISEMLLEAGYSTMKVGKTHLNKGPKEHPLKHGFEHWLGFIHHSWDFHLLSSKDVTAYDRKRKGSARAFRTSPIGPLTRDNNKKESYEGMTTTEVFANEACKFVAAQSTDKPFYLQLEFNAVHTVMTRPPNKELAKKYNLPERPFDRDAEVWEFPIWDPVAQEGKNVDWYKKVAHLGALDPYGRKLYLAYLEEMDAAIGRLMQTLAETGQTENTIVFFSSDNGGSDQSYANNGPLNAYKYCLMDGGIKVPMILSWPGNLPPNEKVDAVVTHRDLFPTLADITELSPKGTLDGKSLMPLIMGKVDRLHENPIFWDAGRQGNWVARQGKWKLVRANLKRYKSYELDSNGLVTEFNTVIVPKGLRLYDMEADPGETKDLSKEMPEKVASLQKEYDNWRAQMANPGRAK
ncbi:MAG: sulfatase-like hydrolase/transferase [Verrucomicrobiota bacterium]